MYDDDDAVGARYQPRLCTADLRVLLSGALKMQDRTMTDTTVTKIAGRETVSYTHLTLPTILRV